MGVLGIKIDLVRFLFFVLFKVIGILVIFLVKI